MRTLGKHPIVCAGPLPCLAVLMRRDRRPWAAGASRPDRGRTAVPTVGASAYAVRTGVRPPSTTSLRAPGHGPRSASRQPLSPGGRCRLAGGDRRPNARHDSRCRLGHRRRAAGTGRRAAGTRAAPRPPGRRSPSQHREWDASASHAGTAPPRRRRTTRTTDTVHAAPHDMVDRPPRNRLTVSFPSRMSRVRIPSPAPPLSMSQECRREIAGDILLSSRLRTLFRRGGATGAPLGPTSRGAGEARILVLSDASARRVRARDGQASVSG